MTIEEARGLAAQAWCKETARHKVMDVDLAEEFAKILQREAKEAGQEVVAGIRFLLDHLSCDDYFCYADDEAKKGVEAVGKWLREQK